MVSPVRPPPRILHPGYGLLSVSRSRPPPHRRDHVLAADRAHERRVRSAAVNNQPTIQPFPAVPLALHLVEIIKHRVESVGAGHLTHASPPLLSPATQPEPIFHHTPSSPHAFVS